MSDLHSNAPHPFGAAPAESEAGFSLIEALVVLAISSFLLVVLTDTLIASQRGHQRLEDHFERRGEVFYLDVQMQALINHLYVDPLLQQSGWQPAINDRRSALFTPQQWRQRDRAPVFEGQPEKFSGEIRNVLSGHSVVEPFQISWVETRKGRQIRLIAGDMDVTWPRYFPGSTQFRFASGSGRLVEQWPVQPDRAAERPNEQTEAAILPDAIHFFDTSRSLTLAVYDVPE